MVFSRRGFLGALSGAALFAPMHEAPAAGAERQGGDTRSDDDPLGIRADFPGASQYTFLNTAYIGLSPRPVRDAGQAWLAARGTKPHDVGAMLAKADEARRLFARLINATPEEIGLLYSTSEGENVVADALDFRAGDNVVIDDLTYSSTPIIHRRLQRTHGVELRVVRHRDGAVLIEDFERMVNDRTRLVSVAWVSNLNGFRHDMRKLADLAHAHGALLYADAIQAVGMGPIDVRAAGVDALCTGTYKWIMAGFGVAPFYFRRELLDRLQPDRVGWHVAKQLDGYQYEPYQDGRKYQFSSLAFGEVYQLAAALEYLEKVGLDRIEAHTLALTRELREGLVARGFRMFTPDATRSSVLSFYVDRPAADAERLLESAGVKVSGQTGDRTDNEGQPSSGVNRIRVAVSSFNNRSDIQHLLSAAEALRRA